MPHRCLVVGGGVLGLFTALKLRKLGWQVTLLEKQSLGAGASSAAGGILSPLYPWRQSRKINCLFSQSLYAYQRFFRETAALGMRVAYSQPGLFCLDVEEYPMARKWVASRHLSLETWPRRQLRAVFPRLRAGSGFFLPDVCQVDPVNLITRLTQLANHHGVRIRENMSVRKLLLRNRMVGGVICEREEIRGDAVVICAGAWSKELIPAAQKWCPVRPVKGQIIEYRTKPGLLPHIVLHRGKYLIPKPDGRILAGSTLENSGFDTTPTSAARVELDSFARSVLPGLSIYKISDQWAGLRPGLATPIVGAHPDIQGLFLNTGHHRNGIVLASGSADWIAAAFARLILRSNPA